METISFLSFSDNPHIASFIVLVQWKRIFETNPSFWLMETDFRLIVNLVLLFKAIFCQWTTFFKLGINQFSLIFSVLNNENSFSGQWKRNFQLILHSGEWKRIFCLVFCDSKQILCQWKPLFKLRRSHILQSNVSPATGNHSIRFFLDIF